MPALDFPTSPTNGQVYGQYTYDSTKGAWRVTSPSTVNNAIISPTAPPSPVAGNIWYNSTDGNTYVYYNDGDTSQWVQLKSDATLSSTLGNRVTSLESTPSGLVPIVPTSVAVASGTASVDANGLTTFTTAGDIRLEGCFSSTFDNYRVIINLNGSSSGAAYYLRLRNAGTTDTSANYYYSGMYTRPSSDSLLAWRSQANTVWDMGRLYATTAFSSASVIDISRPYLATRTHTFTQTSSDDGAGLVMVTHNGINANQTSSDSLAFHPSAGSITGTVKIYGYRK